MVIVLKQNNFGTTALPLHEIFASFYREEFIEITKYKNSQAMYMISEWDYLYEHIKWIKKRKENLSGTDQCMAVIM